MRIVQSREEIVERILCSTSIYLDYCGDMNIQCRPHMVKRFAFEQPSDGYFDNNAMGEKCFLLFEWCETECQIPIFLL